MNRREEARGMKDCCELVSNRQVTALPTPLTDPSQRGNDVLLMYLSIFLQTLLFMLQ